MKSTPVRLRGQTILGANQKVRKFIFWAFFKLGARGCRSSCPYFQRPWIRVYFENVIKPCYWTIFNEDYYIFTSNKNCRVKIEQSKNILPQKWSECCCNLRLFKFFKKETICNAWLLRYVRLMNRLKERNVKICLRPYSRHPKSERSDYGQDRFGSVAK